MDELIAEWNQYRLQAEQLAEDCRSDPARAIEEGVEPRVEALARRPAFDRQTVLAPVNVKAGWLRGAARKVIPAKFSWVVQEMVGGDAALLLLGFNE